MANYNLNQAWSQEISQYNQLVNRINNKFHYAPNMKPAALINQVRTSLDVALNQVNQADSSITLPTPDVFTDMLNRLPYQEAMNTIERLANGTVDPNSTNALSATVQDARGLLQCIEHLHPKQSLEIIYRLYEKGQLGNVIKDEFALREVKQAYENRLEAWGLGLTESDKNDCRLELNDKLGPLEDRLARKAAKGEDSAQNEVMRLR